MEPKHIALTDWQLLENGVRWLNHNWGRKDEDHNRSGGFATVFATNEARVLSRYKDMVEQHGKAEVDEFVQTFITHDDLLSVFIPKQKTCYFCGNVEFWKRPDGGLVCARCHPQH